MAWYPSSVVDQLCAQERASHSLRMLKKCAAQKRGLCTSGSESTSAPNSLALLPPSSAQALRMRR